MKALKAIMTAQTIILLVYGVPYLIMPAYATMITQQLPLPENYLLRALGITFIILAYLEFQMTRDLGRFYSLALGYAFLPLLFFVTILLQAFVRGFNGALWYWWLNGAIAGIFAIAMLSALGKTWTESEAGIQAAKADPLPLNTDEIKIHEIKMKYAWDWFSYHATQRLLTFRFFLIIVGVIAVGYFQCVDKGWRGLGVLLAAFGGLISVAFWLIEVRNEELVNCGRNALDQLEQALGMKIRQEDSRRANLDANIPAVGPISRLVYSVFGNVVFKHRFWLRAVYAASFLGFGIAVIHAMQRYQRWFP